MEQVTGIYLHNFSMMLKMDSLFEGFRIFFLLHLALKKSFHPAFSLSEVLRMMFFFFNIY